MTPEDLRARVGDSMMGDGGPPEWWRRLRGALGSAGEVLNDAVNPMSRDDRGRPWTQRGVPGLVRGMVENLQRHPIQAGLDFVPVVGDAKAVGYDAPRAFQSGQPGMGLLALASVLPMVPNLARGVDNAVTVGTFPKTKDGTVAQMLNRDVPVTRGARSVDEIDADIRRLNDEYDNPDLEVDEDEWRDRIAELQRERADMAGDVARALPMDEASRLGRAREQGFDVEAYHGTRQAVGEFRDNRAYDERGAHYFTSSPEVGSAYAVRPFHRVRAESGVDMAALRAELESQGVHNHDVGKHPRMTEARERGRTFGSNVMPVSLRGRNPFVVDDPMYAAGIKDNPEELDRIFGAGHDVVVLKGITDAPPIMATAEDAAAASQKQDVYIVRDPANIRSRYAAFDPANIGKPGLMGGLAAAVGAAIAARGAAPRRDSEP